jgi:two-component system phosphate regulon response regulator PhoB
LALRQPIAQDLRVCIAALKIVNDLERVGDLAKSIARRVPTLDRKRADRLRRRRGQMGKLVLAHLNEVLDAYATGDADKAVAVWERDDDVDEHYNALFRDLGRRDGGGSDHDRGRRAPALHRQESRTHRRPRDQYRGGRPLSRNRGGYRRITAEGIPADIPKWGVAMQPHVLVVEDEDALSELLQYNLKKEGFRVSMAADGEEALMLVEERQPDVVVLDWMLPKVSGIEVCRRLRSRQETRNLPIIMLTARGEEADRIRGLDTGADDYVVKPFLMKELFARLRAVLRRIRPGLAEDKVVVGDISIDRVAHRVTRSETEVHLGPTEFRLLDYLIQHPGRVFSREQLLDAVWGSDVYVEARTVDVHIGRLRKALNKAGDGDPSEPCARPAMR